MATPQQAPFNDNKHGLFLALLTLSWWQARRRALLLSCLTLGITLAVSISAAVPLLYNVMMTAGLRSTLRATPENAEMRLSIESTAFSTATARYIQQSFDTRFQNSLDNLLQSGQSALLDPDVAFSPPQKNTFLSFYGTPFAGAMKHLRLLQGRFAQPLAPTTNDLEIMVTPDTAQTLQLQVGTIKTLVVNYGVPIQYSSGAIIPGDRTAKIRAHVVGIFKVPAAATNYWHGEDFSTIRSASEEKGIITHSLLLVPDKTLFSLFDHLAALDHVDAIRSTSYNHFFFVQYYQLDSTRCTIKNLSWLIERFAQVQTTMSALSAQIPEDPSIDQPFPYFTHVDLFSPLLSQNENGSILTRFDSRVVLANMPIGIFSLLLLLLILFFVSMITTLLVDSQESVIALLRSRGASHQQIFTALFAQGLASSTTGLLLGLPLALLSSYLFAQWRLPPSVADALKLVSDHPIAAMLDTIWYVLALLLGAVISIGLSLYFAVRSDILSYRRELGRSHARPIWQRFSLDIFVACLALAAYSFSYYTNNVVSPLQSETQFLVAKPLMFISPFFLLISCLLFFLRLFPWLLLRFSHVAARSRGLTSVMALVQVARAPQQPLRRILLLTLATAFALFTLIYTTTQTSHFNQLVTYQVGADISARLSIKKSTPDQIRQQYAFLPGVLSVSFGFIDQASIGNSSIRTSFRAVDPLSFGRTVNWPSSEEAQQAQPLLAHLIALRSSTSLDNVLPVLIDAQLQDTLHLQSGSRFILKGETIPQTITCVFIGTLQHIPTVNPFPNTQANGIMPTGGILADYQSLSDISARLNRADPSGTSTVTVPALNQLWLHISNTPLSLNTVRTTLQNPKYGLSHIVDRYLLLADLQADPLYLTLHSILVLGTVAALLVALLGSGLSSWLSTRTQYTQLVILRSLGATKGQVTTLVIWGHSIVAVTGLILGCILGILLAFNIIPSLVVTDLTNDISNNQLFSSQSALTVQIILPLWLPLLMVAGVGIITATLLFITQVARQPLLSQTLRLNED